MNWITAGGMAGLLAATGAAAQVVEVRAGDVQVARWPGGGGVASPGGTIYGEMDDQGGVKAYYQAGEFLCDDITTSLERPGLLALVEFTWVVGPGHTGDSNCEVRFATDNDGTPDMDPWLGGFDIRGVALDEGTWIVTVDLVGVEDFWLPPGRVWFGVRYTDDEDAALLGQLVGGRPGIGSSDDLLYQPTKGLFELGGAPVANVALRITAQDVCYAECDGDAGLDLFDFLCFQNRFGQQNPYADCNGDGVFDFFDFLCFQNAFIAGC